VSFTHVDPFEDTESIPAPHDGSNVGLVSPTSIRSRILKDVPVAVLAHHHGVSPTSIRSRILKVVVNPKITLT